MRQRAWNTRIKKACIEAGTYKPYFDSVIKTLSMMMARRDACEEEFQASGAEPTIEYTNKGGSTNVVKNPLLAMIDDLDKNALQYWRDLGLTPAGLKKIKDSSFKAAETTGGNALIDKLRELRE